MLVLQPCYLQYRESLCGRIHIVYQHGKERCGQNLVAPYRLVDGELNGLGLPGGKIEIDPVERATIEDRYAVGDLGVVCNTFEDERPVCADLRGGLCQFLRGVAVQYDLLPLDGVASLGSVRHRSRDRVGTPRATALRP